MNDVIKFAHQKSDHSVVFDDDGKVAYAYLLKGSDLIADVWLYNHGQPPVKPEWEDGSEGMPFRNPAAFVVAQPFIPVETPNEIEVRWLVSSQQPDAICADIYIRGKLHARLRPCDKPGMCVLAIKDGPIAKVF